MSYSSIFTITSIICAPIKSRMEIFWYWLTQVHLETRSSADADNLHDAFRAQSRSTNMVPFWVRSDFLLSM